MTFKFVARGGTYFRIADRDWENPIDGSFAMRTGARWNDPGSFPVVYHKRDKATARANLRRRYRDEPYQVEDLDPPEAPILVSTTVHQRRFVDVVTDDGCREAQLPTSYPMTNGAEVSWLECRAVGNRAWNEGTAGIASRSAAGNRDSGLEELAWFQRDEQLEPKSVEDFEEWYWPK